jgi:hypothetical protein
MSMPRYTCIESMLTSSTSGRARATASASADLPDAVVPTTATVAGRTGSTLTRP